MSFEQLSRLDLNLLICLHVLLEQRSVTKAAHKLHLSQSAISKSLSRLRTQFNDPLFLRQSHGLEPTPYARNLATPLKQLLGAVEALTTPGDFQANRSERCFMMAMVETMYPLLLPQFLTELQQQAPLVTIDARTWASDSLERLARGELDFGITGKDIHFQDARRTLLPPKGIVYEELYRDSHCCLVRRGHPLLHQNWDLDAYLSARHLQVRCDEHEHWLLDLKLAEQQRSRTIAMHVPDFNSAASVCAHTDLILTAPGRYARHIEAGLNLVIVPLPMALPPISYTLFWHQHHDSDAGHRWFRELILSRCQQSTPEP
ncbi:LysR family transcriptional regulator [Ferrimonas kyonanensis]|uniref:LysR family transcriptional regulator n=1 Tax=Ferrimonas kyonanensis TaxID=364763 RepID=UPI00040C73DB|nr:LysR family transcriptional regulator [Ferrimonas kyonanensis]